MNEGLKEANIEVPELCTKCNNDLFFSPQGTKRWERAYAWDYDDDGKYKKHINNLIFKNNDN